MFIRRIVVLGFGGFRGQEVLGLRAVVKTVSKNCLSIPLTRDPKATTAPHRLPLSETLQSSQLIWVSGLSGIRCGLSVQVKGLGFRV